jgi:uncharacterized protein (TIGR02647 family)
MNSPTVISPDMLAELELLARFDLHSLRSGIKIHKDAAPSLVSAAVRLHAKGLITASDGGYLSDMWVEVVEHLEHVLAALRGAVH